MFVTDPSRTCTGATPANLWRVLFWQESQINHRRLGEAPAQIYLHVQSVGQVVDQQC